MKIIISLIGLFCLTSFFDLQAQGHEDVLPGLEGSQLIEALRDQYKPRFVKTYKEARIALYTELYNSNDSVECIYSGHKVWLNPDSPDPIADLYDNNNPNGINCEHSWPQSKGAGDGDARSNMYHLYPSRIKVNETRWNHPLQEIPDTLTAEWFFKDHSMSQIPTQQIDLYSESSDFAFEPREFIKGDIARGLFYFATMYRETADMSFFEAQREHLCQWHLDDPVDQNEWDRNKDIARHQDGRRNPFILDCSLAQRTYCGDFDVCDISTGVRDSNLASHGVIISPNPSRGMVSVTLGNLSGYQNFLVKLSNIQGQLIDRLVIHPENGKLELVFARELQGMYSLSLFSGDGQTYFGTQLIEFIR